MVERNPDTSAQKDIEIHLFTTLDEESESYIEEAMQATIAALLSVQCPQNPHRWISACSDIVLGNAKDFVARKTSPQNTTSMRESSLVADTDDDPDITDVTPPESRGLCKFGHIR